MESVHWAGLIGAFVQVALIDLTLAGDNAVAVGMAASGLPQRQRHLAIALGLGLAVVLLCGLAFFAVRLLQLGGGGLILGGGLMLMLICWQMWRDLRRARHGHHKPHEVAPAPHKSLMRALTQIFIADISTSLDNVLAVAGVVRDQPPWVLFAGLALSVVMTALAAVQVAKLLHRWPWIGYIGLVVVFFVAGHMMWDGLVELKVIRL
jgi:YjbE family integral membrane protein